MADAPEESGAEDLAPEELARGGAPEEGGVVRARHDLEQELCRECRRRGRASWRECAAAFVLRHGSPSCGVQAYTVIKIPTTRSICRAADWKRKRLVAACCL
jgi:uncharacterized protein YbbK (DUF523 family)